MLFVEKKIYDFFDGSPISDQRHINTTENTMSPSDIFISIWFGVCYCSNISESMLWSSRLLVFLVLMARFPWNMVRPQLHILLLTVKTPMLGGLHISHCKQKTPNIRRTPSFGLLPDKFSKRVSIIRRILDERFDSIFYWYLLYFYENFTDIIVCQYWFRWWLGGDQMTGYYLNQ